MVESSAVFYAQTLAWGSRRHRRPIPLSRAMRAPQAPMVFYNRRLASLRTVWAGPAAVSHSAGPHSLAGLTRDPTHKIVTLF